MLLNIRQRFPNLVSQLGLQSDQRIADLYRELGRDAFKHNLFPDARGYFDKALHWNSGDMELHSLRCLSRFEFLPVAQLFLVRDRFLRKKAHRVAG
jgi:hypothetical protein